MIISIELIHSAIDLIFLFWYFDIKVVWHGVLSFVAVQSGSVRTYNILLSSDARKNLGTCLELRGMLCHIKLSLKDATPPIIIAVRSARSHTIEQIHSNAPLICFSSDSNALLESLSHLIELVFVGYFVTLGDRR